MTEDKSWSGRVAIITGGSAGIGLATALELTRRGANVVISGRDEARLANAARDNPAIEAVQADSADPSGCRRIVEAALSRWQRLDLIVNNAGAGQPLPVESYDSETIARICAVNIVAPSLLLQAALPALRDTRGAVVNVGTAVSRGAAPGLAHYAATKAALEHLTRSWAVELASQGIRVNTVAPGPVKTGALTGMMGLPPEVAQTVEENEAAQVPLGRRGTTADIVPWIVRLGSPANEWLSGQVITVDGAWSLRT